MMEWLATASFGSLVLVALGVGVILSLFFSFLRFVGRLLVLGVVAVLVLVGLGYVQKDAALELGKSSLETAASAWGTLVTDENMNKVLDTGKGVIHVLDETGKQLDLEVELNAQGEVTEVTPSGGS